MALYEAIEHARDTAEGRNPNVDKCSKCAREHDQLANWLTELKEYRATNHTPIENKKAWCAIESAADDIAIFGHVTSYTNRLIQDALE